MYVFKWKSMMFTSYIIEKLFIYDESLYKTIFFFDFCVYGVIFVDKQKRTLCQEMFQFTISCDWTYNVYLRLRRCQENQHVWFEPFQHFADCVNIMVNPWRTCCMWDLPTLSITAQSSTNFALKFLKHNSTLNTTIFTLFVLNPFKTAIEERFFKAALVIKNE